jgi:hypothetical protein
VARGTILEKVGGAMLGHEEFQLFITQPAIPDPIHHLSLVQEL